MPDFYLSFVMNLLANSLQIKLASEKMITASAEHDTVTFFQQLGALLYVAYDFSSYKTAASPLSHLLN